MHFFHYGDNIVSTYVQYKFNVDGEWRHDEHQPFVSGDCGIVNTMYFVREADMLPPMEVDNDIFRPVASLFSLTIYPLVLLHVRGR